MGQLISLQLYSFFLFGPLQELGNIILAYREAQVSLDNFQRILNTPVEVTPASPAKLSLVNELAFRNVGFQHITAKNKALDAINFTVKTGETIAFVGPSGSGKTTLLNIVVGKLRPDQGEVSWSPQLKMAYLPQEPSLKIDRKRPLAEILREYPAPQRQKIRKLLSSLTLPFLFW